MNTRDLRSPSLAPGSEFSGRFLLRKVARKVARNEQPFLTVEVGDRAGSFSFNLFSDHPMFAELEAAPEGTVLDLSGRADNFNGRFSPRISQIAVMRIEELDTVELDNLVESAPESADSLWAVIEATLARIEPAPLQAAVRSVFNELGARFRVAPAASSMHHAYRHGLLEHTAHMARAAQALLPIYPEVHPGLALAGVLLHDIGKAVEFESGINPRRGRTGVLNGHVVLGYRIARRACISAKLDDDLTERLEHIILSHQGELEWGAAVMAATPEAVFVSMVDNLDARMGMVQRALRTAAPATEFSDYMPGLKTQLLIQPPGPRDTQGA
jgi:3'-5' exoribonuclease